MTDRLPTAGRLRGFWRPETGFFLALWLLLLAGGRSRFFHDPGTFWHTVVGQYLLERGELIRTDPFSFTPPGRPWIAWQWVGEATMAALHAVARFDALLLATATLLAGLYTGLARRLIVAGLHWLPAGVLAAAALAVSSVHFHARPYLGTLLLFGITYAALIDFEAGRIGIRRLFLFVPLFVLWANLHGGFIGGIATLGLAAAGWSALYLVRRPGPVHGPRALAALAALVALCGAAALVNPFGVELPRVWIYVLFGMDLPGYIMEHARLDPTHRHGILVLAAGAAYAAALAATWPRFPRVTWLIPLVWLVQACLRIRNSPLFAIAALLALADFLPYLRCAPWLARRTDLYRPQPEGVVPTRLGWRPLVLPAAAVGLALLLQVSGARVPVLGAGWARLDPANWPVDLLPQLRELESPGGTPVYNEFIDGGFLIYHTPGLRVFNDDRCELYGEPWQREQLGIVYGHPGEMEALVRAYPFRHALVRNNQPMQEYLEASGDWEVLGRGQIATLYRYRGEPVRAVARDKGTYSGSEPRP